MWLPNDIILKIISIRGKALREEAAVVCVQRHWKGYRVRALLERFRILRYLRVFMEYNPCIRVFIKRARL